MRYRIYFSLLAILLVTACHREPEVKEERELSQAEKIARDSISRLQQRLHNDSLKKTNPLLILPPDSMYTGTYVDKYPSGVIKFRGFFRFGKKHGQWMSFYPSGLMWSELHFDKGLRSGPNITYFEKGSMRYTGFYKNDMKDSVWIFYDSTGAVAKKVIYQKDRITKELPAEF